MKTTIVRNYSTSIDTIIDTWMPSNMVVLVGNKEMVICKDGEILTMSIQEAGEIWQHLVEMRVVDARQPV